MPRIAKTLQEDGALVLVGAPGSGKTTRVPPALLDAGMAARGRILVLEPRRLAARAAAARMASERGWCLGREAGYTVRFENRTTPSTKIQVITEGILTRRLQEDPFLEGVSVVILDEFHERSIHSDLALSLIREVRRAGRQDLRLVVMSATLDPAPVAAFLDDCGVITVEGQPYPVEVRHVDAPVSANAGELSRALIHNLRETWDTARGHALIFLPGIGEIRRALRDLGEFAHSRDATLLALHGGLSLDEQQLALEPAPRRKIVLSTNIAETSLTIEGVDLVIDSGLARVLRNDPRHGIDRLEIVRISKHSAKQRAGRAGRLGPGLTIRLWPRREQASLPEAEIPEIRRIDLAATVLELRAWGVTHAEDFGWFESPGAKALSRAEDLLVDLGAVTGRNESLTPTGKAMMKIPTHPRISRLLVAAREEGMLADAALLAALIEEREILPPSARGPRSGKQGPARDSGPSDLLVRMDLLREAEASGFRRSRLGTQTVDLAAARAVARTRDVLIKQSALGHMKRQRGKMHRIEPPAGEDQLLRALLKAYPDRVVKRRSKASDRGRMVGGRGVVLSADSVVQDAQFFVALELDENVQGERLEARVRTASRVERSWIEQDLSPFVKEVTETVYDASTEKIRSTSVLCYRDLPLEHPREMRPPLVEAERLLSQVVRDCAEVLFQQDEAASAWLARARSVADWMPELEWPPIDAKALGEVLAGVCAGRTSLAEIRKLDLLRILQGTLPHEKVDALAREAPAAIRVPSGNSVRLQYEPGRPPILAVRLQEMFGLADTPRVAGGRIPVLLHLLGPNFRPVQITQDLRSFWDNTYAQVRKDLRARYPKHSWPQDPWTAKPSFPGRRRRR